MTLLVSVTGNKVNRPPPCTVMPGLAVRVLRVTALSTSASRTEGGPSGTEPVKSAPPPHLDPRLGGRGVARPRPPDGREPPRGRPVGAGAVKDAAAPGGAAGPA